MKRFISFLLLAIMLCGLVGCNRSPEIPTAPTLTAPPTITPTPPPVTNPTTNPTGGTETSPTGPAVDPTESTGPNQGTEPTEPTTQPTEPTEPPPPEVIITWAGVYQEGAIDVLLAEGPEAISEMLIMSWEEMEADYIIAVDEDGALRTGYVDGENYCGFYLTGDLILPNEGFTEIGEDCFRKCESLTGVFIPNTVTKIGKNAFANSKVNKIHFEEGSRLNRIGYYAFSNCKRLKSIEIPYGVQSIIEGAFYGSNIESIVLPDSIEVLGNNVFAECKKLKTIVLSANLSSISEGLFENCDALTSVVIPDGVTIIKENAFKECDALREVTIPASVEKIEKHAFGYCWELTDIKYKGTTEEWGKIKKTVYWSVSVPADTIICADGEANIWE